MNSNAAETLMKQKKLQRSSKSFVETAVQLNQFSVIVEQYTACHFYLEDPFYLGNDALFFESDVSYVLYGNNHVTIVY